MSRQAALFPEPPATVKVDTVRQEPVLWVRRLVFFANPSEVIREVPLRRGLNIVWSADPGSAAANVGERGERSGHGAGKTLFCRLLRYCLGEDTFANDELSRAIRTEFPEGLVGAEVVVGGRSWSVVRPIGLTRKVLVGEQSPEELLKSETPGTGIGPLLEAIRVSVLSEAIDEHMPGTREWKSWLIALAWLARDQECAFGHILEWRHSRSKSGSPGLSKEEALSAVRLLSASVSAAELQTITKRDTVAAKRKELEAEVGYLSEAARRIGPPLADAFDIEASLLSADDLTSSALEKRADQRVRELEHRLGAIEGEVELDELREKRQGVLQQLAVIRSQVERTEGLVEVQREQIRALRGERANLDAEEIKARLGPTCPVCSVPIDEALATGCGISHILPDFEKVASHKDRLARDVEACETAIKRYSGQLDEKHAIRKRLEREGDDLDNRIAQAKTRVRDERAARRKDWLAAAQLAADARRLSAAYAARTSARGKIELHAKEEDELKDQAQAYRREHRETLNRMESLFRYVCEGLLGAGTEASLSFTLDKLQAQVRDGGTAMESLKAIAFDISVMLLSMEGRTNLPAFLVHDSPRATDLGLSHYHRLFRFIAKLEALGSPAPFQYIITTTTEPPDELRGEPHLVLSLDGMGEADRLLGRAL